MDATTIPESEVTVMIYVARPAMKFIFDSLYGNYGTTSSNPGSPEDLAIFITSVITSKEEHHNLSILHHALALILAVTAPQLSHENTILRHVEKKLLFLTAYIISSRFILHRVANNAVWIQEHGSQFTIDDLTRTETAMYDAMRWFSSSLPFSEKYLKRVHQHLQEYRVAPSNSSKPQRAHSTNSMPRLPLAHPSGQATLYPRIVEGLEP